MAKKSKFPAFSQWKQIGKILKRGERAGLLVLIILFLASGTYVLSNFYFGLTKVVPASGGNYTEGIVGQPRFINPIYGETNDTDRALIDVVFSGLMGYDKDGNIVPDLAERYTVSDDGKTYEFFLKPKIFWHDAKPVTADDIIFTIQTIQNSDYKSPLRAGWINVNAEKTSQNSVRFTMQNPYNSFLENCTIKIIPQHIWQEILPENFALSPYNLQPIGSGPYVFENIDQTTQGFIKSILLKSNSRYHRGPPHIANLNFQFFADKESLEKAANAGEIDGFAFQSPAGKFNSYSFSLPRYFAVFLNQNSASKLFSDANARKAVAYATDKSKLLGKKVDSPIIPDFYGYNLPADAYGFDIEKAKSLLDKAGWKDDGAGHRTRTNTKTPAFQFKNYLAVNSKGSEVAELQKCLSSLPDNYSKILGGETNGTYGSKTETAVTEFQKKYIPNEKSTGEVGKATRAKLNELCAKASDKSQILSFALYTINQPQMLDTATVLKNAWAEAGIAVEIKALEMSDLKTVIKERKYDALLYGEALGMEPDLYPFWHSSQKNDPGLNLAGYENKDADKLLKEGREALTIQIKQEKYDSLQNMILRDVPAIFLNSTDFQYSVSDKIKGIDTTKIADPAKRFVNISNWFIKTKRIWK